MINLKTKDLYRILADRDRTELETALAMKCIKLEKEVGRLTNTVNDYFQFAYSFDRYLGKFKMKHCLGDKFAGKTLSNELGELRARLKANEQDVNSLPTICPPGNEENQEQPPANPAE